MEQRKIYFGGNIYLLVEKSKVHVWWKKRCTSSGCIRVGYTTFYNELSTEPNLGCYKVHTNRVPSNLKIHLPSHFYKLNFFFLLFYYVIVYLWQRLQYNINYINITCV
jgi:hypothetical protein